MRAAFDGLLAPFLLMRNQSDTSTANVQSNHLIDFENIEAAWSLTQSLSHRQLVRTAAVDEEGIPLNAYPDQYSVHDSPPLTPWAMYLTDDLGYYRFVCFDLDASSSNDPHADCERITDLLGRLSIQYVVCRSGGGESRHVWVALAARVPADLVYDLSILVKAFAPSLDRSPLSNPATGCVRPPLSPHRNGGRSEVVAGHLQSLFRPTVRERDLRALCEALYEETRQIHTVASSENTHLLTGVDGDSNPYVVGPKRTLPQFATIALETVITDQLDASSVLWKILIGAAAARWKLTDVKPLMATGPGMEYLRTYRVSKSGQRAARPQFGSQSPHSVLIRQWRYAVKHVATRRPETCGSDSTFDNRAHMVAQLVEHIQTRADASCGRWESRPSDRRVLDALSLLAVTAVRPHVEADIRRLALMCGIGRETVRLALQWLENDGWIRLKKQSSGVNGSVWSIDVQNVIHTQTSDEWSQAVTRPAGVGIAWRLTLTRTLASRLSLFTHDVFTRKGLGIGAGNTFALVHEEKLTPQRVQSLIFSGQTELKARLETLAEHGLIYRTQAGEWKPQTSDTRDTVARLLLCSGFLEARRLAYQRERALFAWWIAEVQWMKQPAAARRATRGPAFGQHVLDGSVIPMVRLPRNSQGRISWHRARQMQQSNDKQLKGA